MRSLAALALLGFSAAAGDPGAAPRIVAGEPVCVSGDRPGVPHVEPFLAAHPSDPSLLFGAAVTLPEAGRRAGRGVEDTGVAGFRSLDGGRSWARVAFAACLVDPWVSFGKGSDVYLSCLTRGARGGAVAVFRSPDGGRTWGRPVRLPAAGGGSADHPILAVDRSEGPRAGTVYVTYAQLLPGAAPGRKPRFGTAVVSSRDGGRSFSAPAFLRRDGLNQQPFDAAVLADGALVVLFMDYASFQQPLARRQAWAARSVDGGRSFSIAALPFEPPGGLAPVPLAADPSATRPGRLYLAVARGALSVLRSDDGGASWREATSPAAGARTPAVAVSAAGIVGLAWYDSRRDPRGECHDVFFSASVDGGRSFLPAARVTPETSCPPAGRDRAVASRWPFGGDYSGLAAAADGSFRIFWSGSRSGVEQVWTAAAEVVAGQ
jgi:hypothetical protein